MPRTYFGSPSTLHASPLQFESMHERLSVVVTCFNQGALIAPILGALLDDLLENDEVIVADDGSTDQSVALIERAAGGDRRVRVLSSIASQSVSRTRNRGMQAATGDWISFLDGDDEYCAGRRAHLTRGMQAFSQAQLLFTDYALWQPEQNPPHESPAFEARRIRDELTRIAARSDAGSREGTAARDASPVDWKRIDDVELTMLLLQHGSVLHVCSLVIRRTWIESRALQFDARLIVAEDTDFVLHAVQDAFVAFLPIVTARYRVSSLGLSARGDAAARMARVVQRVNNLQLPAAAPSTRGEILAWNQVAYSELHLAYQCRLDGHYHSALRHALRSFVAVPRLATLTEVLKTVWLIMKTGAPEVQLEVRDQPVQQASALTVRPKASISGEIARVAITLVEGPAEASDPSDGAPVAVALGDQRAPV